MPIPCPTNALISIAPPCACGFVGVAFRCVLTPLEPPALRSAGPELSSFPAMARRYALRCLLGLPSKTPQRAWGSVSQLSQQALAAGIRWAACLHGQLARCTLQAHRGTRVPLVAQPILQLSNISGMGHASEHVLGIGLQVCSLSCI